MTPSKTQMAPFSAFTALVRGALVDFGFGSLIDKFEERFGRRVTTFLLGLFFLTGCDPRDLDRVGDNVSGAL